MTHRVCGIYSDDGAYGGWGWRSSELFVKEGEVRCIEGKLYYLIFSILWDRYWVAVPSDDWPIHHIIEARCVLKPGKTVRRGS